MSTDSTPPFRLSSHRAQGFTFEHPANWERVYSPRYVVFPVDALKVVSPSMTLLSPCLAIIAAGIDLLTTRQAFYDEFIAKHLADEHGTLIEQNSITLGGDAAVQFTYRVTNAEKDWQAVQVVATKGRWMWIIDGSCLQADWSRWQPTLEKAVRSLRPL